MGRRLEEAFCSQVRLEGVLLCSLLTRVAELSERLSTSNGTLRANPCWAAIGPIMPNCGKQMGTPPRMAFGGAKTAFSLRNRRSCMHGRMSAWAHEA